MLHPNQRRIRQQLITLIHFVGGSSFTLTLHHAPSWTHQLQLNRHHKPESESFRMSSSELHIGGGGITKSTSSWWIKNPSALRRQQRQRQLPSKQSIQSSSSSFSQDFADLFRNISLHGYAKLLEPQYSLWEKLIWFAFHVTVMCVMFVFLSAAWEQFAAQYFATTLYDPLFPIQNVPFPAVSICSSNRISRQAAERYADELSLSDPQKRNASYFLDQIRLLSSFYDKDNSDIKFSDEEDLRDRVSQFQMHLDIYDTWQNETFFNTKRRMDMLSPKCEDLLIKCSLGGKEIDCFHKHAFKKKLTQYGFCCTFNSNDGYRQRSYKNRYVGSDFGLTIILNTSHVDDFSEILSIDGTILIVHDPKKYADVSSGGCHEIFPSNKEESFIPITPRMIDTVKALRSFDPNKRKCLFDDEIPRPGMDLYGQYNFNNCITRCRINSIRVLCKCIPFYAPLELASNSTETVYCTLQHNDCLNSYKFKWGNVLTQRSAVIGLEREMEEALYCPQCIQSCEDIQFEVGLMSLPVDRYRTTTSNLLSNDQNHLEDISVLRIYFAEPHIQLFRRIIVNSWFEAFSTVGNICGIIIGFSLVAFGEIAAFTVKYIVIGIQGFIQANRRDNKKANKKQKQHIKRKKLLIYP